MYDTDSVERLAMIVQNQQNRKKRSRRCRSQFSASPLAYPKPPAFTLAIKFFPNPPAINPSLNPEDVVPTAMIFPSSIHETFPPLSSLPDAAVSRTKDSTASRRPNTRLMLDYAGMVNGTRRIPHLAVSAQKSLEQNESRDDTPFFLMFQRIAGAIDSAEMEICSESWSCLEGRNLPRSDVFATPSRSSKPPDSQDRHSRTWHFGIERK